MAMNENLRSRIIMACAHVLSGEREVELIVHHSDGMWQFMCGNNDHTSEDDVDCVHAKHLFDCQAGIEDVCDRLRPGFLAERADGIWEISAHDD